MSLTAYMSVKVNGTCMSIRGAPESAGGESSAVDYTVCIILVVIMRRMTLSETWPGRVAPVVKGQMTTFRVSITRLSSGAV